MGRIERKSLRTAEELREWPLARCPRPRFDRTSLHRSPLGAKPNTSVSA